MAGLVDNDLSLPSIESLFETLIAFVASLDDLVVVTTLNRFHTYGEADGRIEGASGIRIVEVIAKCPVALEIGTIVHAFFLEFIARGKHGSRNSEADCH